MQLDLTKGTDPSRNSHWWTKERFYLEKDMPTPKVHSLWRLRLVRWHPRFFWSFSLRINDRPPEHSGKFRTWQIYFGWGKADPTRTDMLYRGDLGGTYAQRQCYVLTWTFAEMFAIRKRDLDMMPIWRNQGGS